MIKKIMITISLLTIGHVWSSCCDEKRSNKKMVTKSKNVRAEKPSISKRLENLENRVGDVENKIDTMEKRKPEKKGEDNEEE